MSTCLFSRLSTGCWKAAILGLLLDDDLTDTTWGIYQFTGTGFALAAPTIITDAAELNAGVPIPSVGAIDTYAVVATSSSNPVYYKRYDNTWALVGSDAWMLAHPTITGQVANPSTLAIGQKLVINGTTVTLTGTDVNQAALDISNSGINGVVATVNVVGQIEIRIDGTSASTGNNANPDGQVKIDLGTTVGGTDCAALLGLFTAADGSITTKTLFGPTVQLSGYRSVPAWRTTDQTPRPLGSVWLKTTATGIGATWAIKEYNHNTTTWNSLATPMYSNDTLAINGLDPVGGGGLLPVGTVYVKYDTLGNNTGTFKPYIKNVNGLLKVTGSTPSIPFVFHAGDKFNMAVSQPGNTSTAIATITLAGTTSQALVGAILSAKLPNIVAQVESSGAISISHLAGGTIEFDYITGSPLTTCGIIHNSKVQTIVAGQKYLASPFTALTYFYSTVAPYSNPVDGRLWYYNNPLEVDILINDGSAWRGYKNVSSDARGYNLAATDANGVILATTQPVFQSNGGQLVPGDLWLDTGDLEHYPKLYRYGSANAWELIDNTDQISVDGILFADARWSFNGTTDPVTDPLPSIVALQGSDYLDSDCPDYRLYARGTLLFNTRRSGFNVKQFKLTHLENADVVSTWVTHSGLDADGVPYFGHWAQRNEVVVAMKSVIESSVELREEQIQFNLMLAPGYCEVIGDLIVLNNDRKNTAFILGDSPLTLTSDSTTLLHWASNSGLVRDNGPTGLVSHDPYLGVFYPSGYGTNLDGNSVVVPPSHMMLRTIIRSDNASYPWFAPAGVRRGTIDNATSIGYVDTADGGIFKSIGVTNGLRDILYQQNVNPLTVLPGVGLVNYGQKTRSPMTSSMDRINVARLVCYLRLVLGQIAQPFIFEPNDTITRSQVVSAFNSVFHDLVAKRGVYDFLVVCDTSNNTPDRIDRNELYIDIAIEPVKAIEFIYIPVRLQGTGTIAKQGLLG